MELILVVFISGGMVENSQNGVSRSLKSNCPDIINRIMNNRLPHRERYLYSIVPKCQPL